jgi:DNA mismatch endonuclease, patch repair protein
MPGSVRRPAERRAVVPAVPAGARHRGDIMSPETRSAVMARIKGKNTGPEMLLAKALALHKLRWESHVPDLPGRPDFVFRKHRVVVFVDGDFWHGWRFSIWRDKLTLRWEQKIRGNRKRDLRIHRALRRAGWRVVRIWEHQVERDLAGSVARVRSAIAKSKAAAAQKRGRPGLAGSDLV